jgi:type II secretory pathway pseudopilin PulG
MENNPTPQQDPIPGPQPPQQIVNEPPTPQTNFTPTVPPTGPIYPLQPQPSPITNPINLTGEGDKSFVGAFLLSWLLGSFGADRFYTGKTGTAILKLITLGGLGIWQTIDLILVCFGKFRDKQGRQLKGYEENKGWAKIAGIILAIINILALLIVGGVFATMVLTTSSGIQNKARDSERQTDIKSIQAQLESYWVTNEQYPTLEQMNDQTFRSQKFPTLDPESFKDPKGNNYQLSDRGDSYSYSAYTKDSGVCDGTKSRACTRYTLGANLESGGQYTKESFN